jgi:DNA-binding transcriptional LysR family regulator
MTNIERQRSIGNSWMGKAESLNIRLGVPREYFHVEGLARLRTLTNPAFQLHITFDETLSLMRGLESNAFDAVVSTQKIARRGWHYLPLLNETIIAIGQAALPVPREMALETAESWLARQAWIAYAPDLPIIRRFWQDVFGNRPSITPRLVMPDVLAVIRAVTLGLGVSVVPAYLCREELTAGLIRELWTPPQPSTNTLYLVCERARLETPEVRWVADLLKPAAVYT